MDFGGGEEEEEGRGETRRRQTKMDEGDRVWRLVSERGGLALDAMGKTKKYTYRHAFCDKVEKESCYATFPII